MKERKEITGGTHMSVSKELESCRAILGPYENMMVSIWVHIVYGHRKWYISSLGL